MTTRKVQNPNQKGGNAFIWAIVAVIAIAALVIGLIVSNGKSQRSAAVREEMIDMSGITVEWAQDDNVVHLIGANPDAPTGQLFEDFSCGYCAELHKNTDAEMIEALKAGEINVDLHPMMFQDRGLEGHSTRSLAAMLALIAHGDVDQAFSLRDYLFVNQQATAKYSADDMANLADGYGASKDAVSDIREGAFMEKAKEVGDANLKLQQDETGEAWTPRVWIDGKDAEDLGDREAWITTLKNS